MGNSDFFGTVMERYSTYLWKLLWKLLSKVLWKLPWKLKHPYTFIIYQYIYSIYQQKERFG